ncbi:MAG: UPF0236 family protein [Megasphaera sp.]|nr:UPF0236 family protein [Megasphaera sp.]
MSHDISLPQVSQKLEQLLNALGVSMMETLLEESDAAMHASFRSSHRYHVKSHRSRTLTTLWGDVTYTRTYYQDIQDATCHYLLDEWMGLQKLTHIDLLCRVGPVSRC